MHQIISYIVAFSIVFATSLMGNKFTSKTIVNSSWYQKNKSPLTPPNFVFPIVWTILYILIALAIALELRKVNNYYNIILSIFAVNMILNVFWCYLYFSLKNIVAAFICLVVLNITTALIIYLTKHNTTRYLLLPYLLWTLFACLLNYLSIYYKYK